MNSYRKFFKRPAGRPAKKHQPLDVALFSKGTHVFCDGACEPNPGAGGWAFAVYQDGIETTWAAGGEVETTNNIMELTGMLRAVEWAAANGATVTIWCDSQYVVNGCNDWRKKWKANGWRRGGPNAKPENSKVMNLELWKEIDAALESAGALVTIAWVKGHNGTAGNERADELSLIGRQQAIEASADSMGEDLDAQFRGIMAG